MLINFFKNYFSKKPKNSEANMSTDELSQMTVVNLRSLARNRGMSGYSRLNKAELINFLATK